jgi:predicted Zn finger-like uncharacterized protein
MPVNISCPNCGKSLALQEAHMGKKVRCPGCQQVFTANPPEENIQPAEEMEAVQERPSRTGRPRAPEPEEEEEAARPRRRRAADEDEDVEGGEERVGAPHRGGTVLTMGILALVFALCCPLICWIVGGIGLSMASTDLGKMARRQMDRTGQGMTNTAKILCIVGLIIGTLNAILGIVLQVARK